MYKSLPPLNALRAFEAAARHLSMVKAAEELNVSASALSHQIRGLEKLLGIKLFERRVRRIELTREGEMLAPGLQSGFAQIRTSLLSLMEIENSNVLVISTPPGFTAKWLAPRLHRFSSLYPDIDVRITSTSKIAEFGMDGINVAIRNLPLGQESNDDITIEHLIDIEFIPVCTPEFSKKHEPLDEPSDLIGVPLIHDEMLIHLPNTPTWADWFAAAGLSDVDVRRGLRFNSSDHALEAAAQGAGILLGHNVLALDDLLSGRLVAPFDLTLSPGRALYVVYPTADSVSPATIAFRNWINQEINAVE